MYLPSFACRRQRYKEILAICERCVPATDHQINLSIHAAKTCFATVEMAYKRPHLRYGACRCPVKFREGVNRTDGKTRCWFCFRQWMKSILRKLIPRRLFAYAMMAWMRVRGPLSICLLPLNPLSVEIAMALNRRREKVQWKQKKALIACYPNYTWYWC